MSQVDVMSWRSLPCYGPFVREFHGPLVGFPHKWQLMRSFDFYFAVRLNKMMNKLECRWIAMPCRLYDYTVMQLEMSPFDCLMMGYHIFAFRNGKAMLPSQHKCTNISIWYPPLKHISQIDHYIGFWYQYSRSRWHLLQQTGNFSFRGKYEKGHLY